MYEVQKGMGRFVRRNADLFRSARPFARVGLLYSENNRAWHDLRRTYGNAQVRPDPTRWFAQVLADSHVPYVVLVAERDVDRQTLAGLDAIVLADQACASERTLSSLSSFLEGGGGVIVTGELGRRDADGMPRPDRELARRPLTHLGPGLHRVGKGRLARVAQRPEEGFYRSCRRDTQSFEKPPAGPMERPGPVPASLREALAWAVSRPLVRLEARPTTVVSLTETPGHLLIHLVNYDLFEDRDRIAPEPDIYIWFRPPRPIDGSKAELASSERDPERVPLPLTREGEGWTARIGKLESYGVIALPWLSSRP